MDIQEFLGIAVVGAFVSMLIEFINSRFSSGSTFSKFITLLMSVLFGGLYVWVRSTAFFPTVIMVLGTASIVYGFFIKKAN